MLLLTCVITVSFNIHAIKRPLRGLFISQKITRTSMFQDWNTREYKHSRRLVNFTNILNRSFAILQNAKKK